MSELQINTERGQQTIIEEGYVIEKIEELLNVGIVETNKKRESKCDNLMYKKEFDEIKKREINTLHGICEIKCRHFSLNEMYINGDTWLITYQKLVDCASLSKELTTPFYGFCYLMKDEIILYWEITNDKGEFLFPFDVELTETQYCVNPELGKIKRINAYLPRKYSKVLYDKNDVTSEINNKIERSKRLALKLKENIRKRKENENT